MLPTLDYLYGLRQGEEHEVEIAEGKRLILGLQAISDAGRARLPHGDGDDQRPAAPDQHPRPERLLGRGGRREGRPVEARPGRGAVPGRGRRSWSRRAPSVAAGDTVATIEAMKMEASITAPVAGTVQRLAISGPQSVEGGDLVLVLA